MKKILAVLLLLGTALTGAPLALAAPPSSGRTETDLSGPGWRLWRDTNAAWQTEALFAPGTPLLQIPSHPPTGGWSQVKKSKTLAVSVPGTVEEYLGNGSGTNTDVVGVTWWLRKLRFPEVAGARLRLCFEAARQRAEVYLDGKLVGYDLVGNTPFEADLTGCGKPGQECELAVRITDPGGNFAWQDGAPIPWGDHFVPISHGFGGITGRVKLFACAQAYVDDIYVQNTPAPNEVNVILTLKNTTEAEVSRDLQVRIVEPGPGGADIAQQNLPDVRLAPGATEVRVRISAPTAKLWDLDRPNLYRCIVALKADGQETDADERRMGFRWFAPEGIGEDAVFRLNGHRIVLRTAISWGFFPINGIYATPQMADKQVRAAKALGLNMLTFHRCIGSPRILEKADELGLLYYEEPGGYRSAGTDPLASALMSEKLLRMVRRDCSHPSLAILSLINERDAREELRPRERADLVAAHAADPSRVLTLSSSWAGSFERAEVAKTHLRPFDDTVYQTGWWDNHRAGGPEVWREQFSPTRHLGYTSNKKEIVFRGEEGALSAPPRLAAIRAELKREPRLGWDGAVYLDWFNTFETFIKRKHLGQSFSSVDALTTAMGAVSHYNQGRRIEDHRLRNLNDGYAINGWESEVAENHSGVVDCFRNPKADPSLLAYYNQPRYIAVKVRNPIVELPGAATADFYLINENDLHGPHKLTVSVRAPSGETTFCWQQDIVVHGGEEFGQALTEGLHVPLGTAAGRFHVEATLTDATGKQTARGGDEILAVDWRSGTILGKGAVYEWGAAVADFLKSQKHCEAGAFTDAEGPLDWVLVARAPYEQPRIIAADSFVDASGKPAPLNTLFAAGRDFARPLHERHDTSVDFHWPVGSTPDPAVSMDSGFGTRFEGWVLPPRSGDYTFVARSSGPVRLWVDDHLLIDKWIDRPRPENQGTLHLQGAKPAKVRLEFFHRKDSALLQLLWSVPPERIISPERLFERARRDGTTLLLVDYTESWMPLLEKFNAVKYGGTFDVGTAWLGGQYFVGHHPLFKDLPQDQAMNWEYQKLVQTGRSRYALKVEGEALVVGCYQSQPFQLGTAVGLVPCGKGRIIFSTLAVAPNLASSDEASSVARKLLCNCLNYAGTVRK